ncbi:sodium bicarbonate cotransporter 3 isoform X21 [Chrysemys picta bellii]|uniref:sodium bicarbonate cotransporter 3 isoform X21 n=1 Tax=Chrysemys picta bellii TaxID=8478 RepID=UPI0032B2E2C4
MEEERAGEQMRPLLTTGHDEEAVVDMGKTSSTVNTNFEKEELESHRAVYIGVHVPFGKEGRRRHRHRGHRHHRRRKEKETDREDGRESPSYDTPSQRVQFILGTEDDDEEHIPHDLFTEMDELYFKDGEEYEWKETARWLKFEEDVEDGGDRWSKPYVATLSLHSLFELRSCILNGTVMLDMRANTLDEIADMVLDNMIASGQLDESIREHVREALLKRHHHQNEKKFSSRIPLVRSFADIGKKHSDPHLLERNGEGLSASHHSLRTGLSASNISLKGEKRLSLLLHYLLPSSRAGTPADSRCTTPLPTPQNTPPSSPSSGRLATTSSQPSQLQGKELLVSPASDDIPTVIIHPPEEDLEVQEKKTEDNIDIPGLLASPQSAPGNLDAGKSGDVKGNGTGGSRENSTVDFSKESASWHCSCGTLGVGLKRPAVDMNFMRKIPTGAEASNVLVGEVDFLERPIIAFVRLSPAVLLSGLTEVPVPTRFLFLLLGPAGKAPQYHEIGRSIATLMTDDVFHDVAYKAKDRNDLLSGIDEFLDQVTVLPPGEWDPSIRIEPPKSVPSQEKRKIPKFPNGSTSTGEILKQESHHAGPELRRTGRCVCSEPQNPSNETLQMWLKTNTSVDTITWTNLTVSECKKFHGVFLGSACGHDGPYIPDVLFWSVILFFTTFFLSSFLKQFKTKRYFPTKVRSTISDFAVFLTIVIMVLIDWLVGVPSAKLHVPEKFEPTQKDRGWLIDPLGGNPWWTLLVAAFPALLCTILIFMDQQITAVIINRKEHKLKKGCGYHLDLLMVGVMLGICSIMGLPWFVAATVLSISHVNSLKVESECSAPGEQPKFLGIREQRVTGLMIFVLMGLSVFMTSVLKFIPMPVLYGVFLYMGASSLRGIQFFDRIKLFGMPAKHQPDLIYLRYVPLWKVHVFTVVQLTCLVLLWVIKASAAAVVFPMMVLALVFIRKLMDLCFTKRELSWLDDLMPESKKKKEDDKKKKAKEEAERMLQTVDSETVHLPYEGGNVLQIPVKALKYSIDPSIVNISDEMAKTAQWKALAMSTENAKVTRANLSPEKPESVKISMEDSPIMKYVDAETSL